MRNWRRKAGASLAALVVMVMMAGPVRAITTHHPSDADAGEYPYAVALVDAGADSYDGQFCGGSVIGDRWILTAAHCVTTEDGRAIDPSAIEAVIGRTDLTSAEGERIAAVGVAVHPDYDPQTTSNDLAVIELATATTASSVALPSAGEGSEGTAAVVVGWGEDSDGDYPTALQETEVTLVGDDDCSEAYDGDFDGSSMLCAGDTQPGGEGDSCYGDSGGPLVVSTSEGPVVVGVVSWGYECDGAYPGVYAEVGAETEWIGSVLSGETPTETDGAEPEDDSEDGWFDEDFDDDGWFDDEWLDEDLTDAEIAEIQAEDAAIIAALEAAGIDFEVETDELGDFPVFDESDPDAWAVVDAVLEDLYGDGWFDEDFDEDGWFDEDFDDDGWFDEDDSEDGWFDEDFDEDGWFDEDDSEDGWFDEDFDEDGWFDEDFDEDGWFDEDFDEDGWFDEDFDEDGWFDDEWLDEDLTDGEIAEIQAEDAAIIAALEAAGIDFEVETDEIGDFPVFDESDPDAWAVVDAVLEDLYG